MRRLLVEKHWAPRWKSVQEEAVPMDGEEDGEDEGDEGDEGVEGDRVDFGASESAEQAPGMDGLEDPGGLDEGGAGPRAETGSGSCTSGSRRRSPPHAS